MQSNKSWGEKIDNRSKGQATLEYMLLLFVILAIAFGSLTQFSTAFQKFAGSYFGQYLTCLIETGELPTLNAATTDSVCADQFEPFSLADGKTVTSPPSSKPNLDGSSNSGSGTGSPSSSTSNNSSTQSNNLSSVGAAGVGDSTGVGSRNVPLNRKESFAGGDPSPSGRTTYVPVSQADSGKKGSGAGKSSGELGGGDGFIPKPKNGDDATVSESGRLRYIPSRGGDDSGTLRAELVPANESDAGRRGRRVAADRSKKKGGPLDDEDVGLTFPNFIKFILITCIIIVIIVFVGGQALQISKSQEK